MRSKLSEFIALIDLVVAIALVVAACGGNDEETRATEPATAPPVTEPGTPALHADGR